MADLGVEDETRGRKLAAPAIALMLAAYDSAPDMRLPHDLGLKMYEALVKDGWRISHSDDARVLDARYSIIHVEDL